MKWDNEAKEYTFEAWKKIAQVAGVAIVLMILFNACSGMDTGTNEGFGFGDNEDDIEKTIVALDAQLYDVDEVNYNSKEKVFEIDFRDEQSHEELEYIIQMKDRQLWQTYVSDLFFDYSETVTEHMGEGYGVRLLNPWDSDRYFLEIKDGRTQYNYMDELKQQ